MALNNLNNPYSPQPSTPVGSIEAETVSLLDQSQQSIAQFQASDRSRHSSAESEPALRTTLMSPLTEGGNIMAQANFSSNAERSEKATSRQYSAADGSVRQRHASAGQVESSQGVMQTVTWLEELHSMGGKNDGGVPYNIEQEGGGGTAKNQTLHKSSDVPGSSDGAAMPDDLDMALSALKDCDNEFSKFVAETEENWDNFRTEESWMFDVCESKQIVSLNN